MIILNMHDLGLHCSRYVCDIFSETGCCPVNACHPHLFA